MGSIDFDVIAQVIQPDAFAEALGAKRDGRRRST